jgi:hypothetical protein
MSAQERPSIWNQVSIAVLRMTHETIEFEPLRPEYHEQLRSELRWFFLLNGEEKRRRQETVARIQAEWIVRAVGPQGIGGDAKTYWEALRTKAEAYDGQPISCANIREIGLRAAELALSPQAYSTFFRNYTA